MTPKFNPMYKTENCCNFKGNGWENFSVANILFEILRLRDLNCQNLEMNATQEYKTW